MGHHFESGQDAELPATPEEVWQAIATGPGIDSWYMGRSQVHDGVVTTEFGGILPKMTVTASEPGHRFTSRGETSANGRFVAFDFLIQGRADGSTNLRMVTSGFLPGDDWGDEFEAMTLGGELYWRTLVTYLTHFPGRTATPITAFGPQIQDPGKGLPVLLGAFGLTSEAAVGDAVHARLEGLPPIDGVVFHVNPVAVGIRTERAMYRFIHGYFGNLLAGHHLFEEAEGDTDENWAAWLGANF